MRKRFFQPVVLALSIFASMTIPAIAQQVPVPMQGMASISPQTAEIPQATAITVLFPSEILMDAKQKQDYTATALLAQPIMDISRNVVVPANAPVTILLHPTKQGADLIANSLVIAGQVFPIQTSSIKIAGTKIAKTNARDQAQANSSIYTHVLGGFGGTVGNLVSGGKSDKMTSYAETGGLLGMGIGSLTGMLSSDKALAVRVPQGSVYVLTLQTPLSLSMAGIQPTLASSPAPASPAETKFKFQTEQEYQAGLNNVLQAYQQHKLSQADAIGIIRAANHYATTQLPTPIYPSLQQRQFIQQTFGLSYAASNESSTLSSAVGKF